MKHETRETWLQEGLKMLDAEFFSNNGYVLPEKLHVSCAFPTRRTAIGSCFSPELAVDKTTHIFICPSQQNPLKVLDILLHEMIHAYVGTAAGHKGPFKKLVKEFGLAGKVTSTFAEEGSDLHKKLEVMVGRIGKYPHATLNRPGKGKGKGEKKNSWVRLQSPDVPDYKVVVSPITIEKYGMPKDPWGNDMVFPDDAGLPQEDSEDQADQADSE